MRGRAWTQDPVSLELTVLDDGQPDSYSLGDYLSGIADTLDGCSGYTFTYLPIVFEDDSQIARLSGRWVAGAKSSYVIKVTFGAPRLAKTNDEPQEEFAHRREVQKGIGSGPSRRLDTQKIVAQARRGQAQKRK